MRGFLLGSLALAIQHISAHPQTRHSQGAHKRVIDLNEFRLKTSSEYVNATAINTNTGLVNQRATPQDTATELVKETVPGAKFRLVESYTGKNGVAHFYFKQTVNDLDIDNADFNVNIGRDGKVFSYGNSFYKGDIPPASELETRNQLDPVNALKGAVDVLRLPVIAEEATSQPKEGKETFAIKDTKGAVKEPEARLVYFRTAEGKLVLTWRVETDIWSNWLLTYVDANNGENVHGVVDYSSDATYEVYAWGLNDPTEGERTVITDPWNNQASEFGWHSTGNESFIATRGNNGISQINPDNSNNYLHNPRASNPNLTFEYPYSLEEADWLKYFEASTTQLFYTANVFHDLLYILGFDEQAGNFEVNNNGGGGIGNDFVILNSQDGYGKNNAHFDAPPDGQPGRMRMFIWDKTSPVRDSSFDAGVVIHEYTHGLSNRLTGGPANSGCLSILEADGMDEGWSDFFATTIRLKPGDTRSTDYTLCAWASGDPMGIRDYLYSTDMEVNPFVYTDANSMYGAHDVGTIWATMLYEVLWNLIDKHGKNDNPVPDFDEDGVPTDGRYLALKLVMDGMALQPCNPNFVSARDAMLDADKVLTGGQNACELWTGFAKRGLGAGAVYKTWDRVNSFEVLEGVC